MNLATIIYNNIKEIPRYRDGEIITKVNDTKNDVIRSNTDLYSFVISLPALLAIIKDIPIINVEFITVAPNRSAMEIISRFCVIELTAMNISGKLVPIAITKNPIINGFILKYLLNFSDEETNISLK